MKQPYNNETPAQLLALLIAMVPKKRTVPNLRRFKLIVKFVETNLDRSFDIYKTAYTPAFIASIKANIAFVKRQWGIKQ